MHAGRKESNQYQNSKPHWPWKLQQHNETKVIKAHLKILEYSQKVQINEACVYSS
jgi:hypothetical protein